MQSRVAFVDDQVMAKDYATGDIVRKVNFRDYFQTPYAGRVIYSNPKTGKVQVQWPWGAEQESPTELIREVSPKFVPPIALNQWYSTWEGSRMVNDKDLLKEEDKWRKALTASTVQIITKHEQNTMPVWRQACKAWHDGLDEVEAFRVLSFQFGEEFGDETIRLTISNLYSLGRQTKLAIYWKDNTRRYKVTKKEKDTGRLKCPRCGGTRMKPRVYRQGKKLIQCRDCGFSISPKDLIWPSETISDIEDDD
jgi:hypothetical protein